MSNLLKHTILSRAGLLGIAIAVLWSTSVFSSEIPSRLPFPRGETIHYTIKQIGIKVGKAQLVFNGLRYINNEPVYQITFTATAPKFSDEEKIYLNPDTFYPVRIDRDLTIFGKKEKITEYYDTGKGLVKIVKLVKGKESLQEIQKSGNIDNIYSFLYRYRHSGKFEVDENLQINLPTRDVKFKLVRKEDIKIGKRKVPSYYMKSEPKKYKVWFDASKAKIPLRIDGAIGLAKTSMVMTEYDKGL